MNDPQSDWHAVEPLLKDWRAKAWENQVSHHDAAQHYAKRHRWLGIPAVAFSTIVGTTVFAAFQKQTESSNTQTSIVLIISGVSILSAILTGMQTFLRLSELAEHHRAAGAEYSSIRRLIDEILFIPPESRGPCKDFLDQVRKRLDELAKTAPNVPNKIWKHAFDCTRQNRGPTAEPQSGPSDMFQKG
jgi:hypothetical protein